MKVHSVKSGLSSRKLLSVILADLSCSLSAFEQNEPILLEDQRELFVDNYLLETVENAEVYLATPVPRGAFMEFYEPWEGQFCAYVSVVDDGEFFHMYYRGLTGYENKGDQQVTCYAISTDGIHWRKPDLGLFEVYGTWNNNMVMYDNPQGSSHNFSVLFDDREGVPREEKVKVLLTVLPCSNPF